MHIEILVEDTSGQKLIDFLLPKIIGQQGEPHTWRTKGYKGVGRIPRDLNAKSDPKKRILLEVLPRLLRGYGQTAGIDAVVVVVDTDIRDCVTFLKELRDVANKCNPCPKITMFRLAIEEIEAWYFGDQEAVLKVYPQAKRDVLKKYKQDSVCGTWEKFAEAVVVKSDVRHSGDLKHEWAEEIGPLMEPDKNLSPSFKKFAAGLRQLTTKEN